MGGSNFGASGGPVWDAPADAPRARPEANFGTLCGRDTGVLAEPARGTFFGHVACHAQGGAHLACLSGSFYLCRSYAYNDNFWTDFHHFCNVQREPRATMCNAPGGLENESEKWTYFWVRKMVQEIIILRSICRARNLGKSGKVARIICFSCMSFPCTRPKVCYSFMKDGTRYSQNQNRSRS